MKKMLLFIAAVAILAACSKKESSENTVDKWNGYEDFYKAGEMYKDLVLRKGTVVGTVTYGIDDDANFYVTYETDGDWELVKTHMYAGKWRNMPKRKRRKPKVKDFPNKTVHSPYVNTYTYTVPLVDLPPAEEPGFVVAAGARVFTTNKCGDDQYTYKKAWASWDRRFSCKTWGGYSNYYYNQPYEPHTILYGTEYRGDSLAMYLIDATDGTSTLIATEFVGTPPADTYDGAAYDPNTNQFFFTNYELQELWVNNMDSTDSYKVGDLDGIAASATLNNGNFYYVDENNNDIKEVVFTGETDNLTISSESVYSEIPSAIAVNDIAFDPAGENLYLIGVYNTNVELIGLEVSTDTYSTIQLDESVQADAQIAYGDDGDLYMVSGSIDGGGSIVSTISPETGVSTPIDEDDVIPVPLGDLAGGPLK